MDCSLKGPVHRHPALHDGGGDLLALLALHQPGLYQLAPHVNHIKYDGSIRVNFQVKSHTLPETITYWNSSHWSAGRLSLQNAAVTVLGDCLQLGLQHLLVPVDAASLQEVHELVLGLVPSLLVHLPDDLPLLTRRELLLLDHKDLVGLAEVLLHDVHSIHEGRVGPRQNSDDRMTNACHLHVLCHPKGRDLRLGKVQDHTTFLHGGLRQQQRNIGVYQLDRQFYHLAMDLHW